MGLPCIKLWRGRGGGAEGEGSALAGEEGAASAPTSAGANTGAQADTFASTSDGAQPGTGSSGGSGGVSGGGSGGGSSGGSGGGDASDAAATAGPDTRRGTATRFNPSGARTFVREYLHTPPGSLLEGRGSQSASHVDIMGNYALIEDILRVAAGMSGEEIGGDKIYSGIHRIAERVDLEL